jgi:2-dehydrotetronate isomerase
MQVSANIGFLWGNLPFLARFEAASKAGFKVVECHTLENTPHKEVLKALKDNGLTLLGMNAAMENGGIGAVADMQEKFKASVNDALEFCVNSNTKNIHILAGSIKPVEKIAATALWHENLLWAASIAAKQGINLLIEPLNPIDRPNYFYSTQREALNLILTLGQPNIKLMSDIYHIALSEGNIINTLTQTMPFIGHIQVASAPKRCEIDEGEVNYHAIFAHLKALGYNAPIGLEYKPRGSVEEGLQFMKTYGLTF